MADNRFGFKSKQQQDDAYEQAMKRIDEMEIDKKVLQDRLSKSLDDLCIVQKRLGVSEEQAMSL